MTRQPLIDPPHDSTASSLNGPSAHRNGTLTPARPDLLQLVDSAIERYPRRIAIESGNNKVLYSDLAASSIQLAHWLCNQGVGPDIPVGVRMEKSPESLIAILAILRAGGAYLPLDPHYPAERLAM